MIIPTTLSKLEEPIEIIYYVTSSEIFNENPAKTQNNRHHKYSAQEDTRYKQ